MYAYSFFPIDVDMVRKNKPIVNCKAYRKNIWATIRDHFADQFKLLDEKYKSLDAFQMELSILSPLITLINLVNTNIHLESFVLTIILFHI